MKKSAVVLFVLCVAVLMSVYTSVVHAAVVYTVSSESYEWEMWGVIILFSSADDTYASYTLPFNFPYYGTTYTTIYVSSNGIVTLDSGLSSYIPQNYFSDRLMIGVMGEDLVTTAYVTVHSNYVTILWYGRLYGMNTERDLMLVRLYDNGNIFMSYADWVSPDYWGRDAVAGVSAGDGVTDTTIAPADETAFLFTYIEVPPDGPSIPEFSLSLPVVTSLAATIYLAVRKRISRKLKLE